MIPDPVSAISCEKESISQCLKSTGFQNVKASRIIKLSQKWVDGFSDAIELPGIGKYGRDSWEIFVKKNLSVEPADKKLIIYLDSIKIR